MSYADEADLAADIDYRARVQSALWTEAKGREDALADTVLSNSGVGLFAFMPWLSTAPGFGDKYADGGQSAILDADILSAVQASWDDVAAVNAPPPG